MEDSGFDSDQQKNQHDRTNGTESKNFTKLNSTQPQNAEGAPVTTPRTSTAKSAQLQKKIARQREAVRSSQASRNSQPVDPLNRRGLLSRNRLPVPTKGDAVISSADMQPLVMLETDESEDEFTMPSLSVEAHKEITQQLIKDGYNLDLEPDDEDLDLIPPRPLNERCVCCPGSQLWSNSCSLQ